MYKRILFVCVRTLPEGTEAKALARVTGPEESPGGKGAWVSSDSLPSLLCSLTKHTGLTAHANPRAWKAFLPLQLLIVKMLE